MRPAKLFTHGGSQAVRLPKEFRFAGNEVYIRRVGVDVVLSPMPPAGADALLQAIAAFDRSRPLQREQPAEQQRAELLPPRD